MTTEQVHLAGAVVALFSLVIIVWQLLDRGAHVLWLLMLMVGLVAFVVTL